MIQEFLIIISRLNFEKETEPKTTTTENEQEKPNEKNERNIAHEPFNRTYTKYSIIVQCVLDARCTDTYTYAYMFNVKCSVLCHNHCTLYTIRCTPLQIYRFQMK